MNGQQLYIILTKRSKKKLERDNNSYNSNNYNSSNNNKQVGYSS